MKSYEEFVKEFSDGLQLIEDRYIEFFKGRPSRYSEEEHDRIKYHFTPSQFNGYTSIKTHDEADLPQAMIQEVKELAESLFK